MYKLSTNLWPEEVMCHCPRREINIHPVTVQLFEDYRHVLGDRVLYVASGGSCPEHNATIGRSFDSAHTITFTKLQKALDLCQYGRTAWELAYFATLLPQLRYGGIGVYPDVVTRQGILGFVHIDHKERRARWMVINGEYKAFTDADFEREVRDHTGK